MADKIPFDADRIEAEENFLIDFQFLIQELMVDKNITRAELSERTGMSIARLSQIFSSEANPTAKTMARIFHALGETAHLSAISRQASEFASRPLKDDQWKLVEAVDLPAKRQDSEMVAMVKRSMASNDNIVVMTLGAVSKAA